MQPAWCTASCEVRGRLRDPTRTDAMQCRDLDAESTISPFCHVERSRLPSSSFMRRSGDISDQL
jgi:hypothetical protein